MGGTGLEDVYTSMFFGCVLGGFVRLQGVAVCDVVLIIPKAELCGKQIRKKIDLFSTKSCVGNETQYKFILIL